MKRRFVALLVLSSTLLVAYSPLTVQPPPSVTPPPTFNPLPCGDFPVMRRYQGISLDQVLAVYGPPDSMLPPIYAEDPKTELVYKNMNAIVITWNLLGHLPEWDFVDVYCMGRKGAEHSPRQIGAPR